MIDEARLTELAQMERDDVFSLTLNTDPSLAQHQRPNPAYRIWAHDAVHRLLHRMPPDARRRAEPSAQRLLAHVDAMPQEGRGLAIFAAPDLWETWTVPFPLPNHLAYGRPDTVAALWAIHEYPPYAIVLVSHDRARLLVAYLGRAAVVDEIELDLHPEQWRFKTGRMATSSRGSGIGVGRGIQSSAHEARVLAQHHRFWRDVAEAAARMLTARRIDRVILGGDAEAAGAVSAALPGPLRDAVVGTAAVPAYATVAEIGARVLPIALADHRARDRRVVRSIAEERHAGGTGVDGAAATLNALTAGTLRVVVAARDMHAPAWVCSGCGRIAATASRCAVCGGEPQRLVLPQALPLLTARHGAALQLIDADAAAPLADGIGGLLRRPPAAPATLDRGA